MSYDFSWSAPTTGLKAPNDFLQSLGSWNTGVMPTTADYGLGYQPKNASLGYMGGGTGINFPQQNTTFQFPGGGGGGDSDFWSMRGLLGGKNADGTTYNGWGGMALGAAGGLMQGFLGMKQYGLAKKSLEEGKRQFQMNYDAQKATTNAALEDRQRARVSSNPGAYMSVGEYMDKHGIK